MFDRIIHFFVPDHFDSLSYKFNVSVPSSYFKRLAVAWVFWNWKIFLLLFFVSEAAVVSKYTGLGISKIDWITEQYDSWWKVVLYVISFPALSALFIYALLELISCASYYFVKRSWRIRTRIENKVNLVTPATNKMVSEYLEEKNNDQLKLNQLANDILYKEDLLKKGNDELNYLRKENASLNLRAMESENPGRIKQLQEEVQELIKKIDKAKERDQIRNEFETTFRKINGNSGKIKIKQPSQHLEFLVLEKLLAKYPATNEYSITQKGEVFNAFIILQPNEDVQLT